MTEQNAVESAPVGEGKTADLILADIEAAQRQLESQGPAKPEALEPKPASEPNQVEPEPADKPSETPDASEPGEVVPAPQGSDKSGEVEELMKKKGFKTIDDIVRSYRNLERKMHGQGKGVQQPPVNIPMAQTAYQPNPPEFRPSAPTAGLQQLADAYQMTPEDIQKIAQLSNDIADFKLRQQLTPLVEQFTGLKRDYDKDASFKRLERDPLFRNREVQLEMHQLAEEDPSVLDQPDYPERLFDRALSRIGRRFAEGSGLENSINRDSRLGLPGTPPPSGRGSAGGPKGIPLNPPTSISSKDFKRLSVAEMEKELRKKGAIHSED
jgi:hypothetical protein